MSIYRFWYPQRVLEPVCPAGTKGQLYTHTHTHAHTHTHTATHRWNITQPHTIKELLTLVRTWMDLENIMLSEISQIEIDRYVLSHLIMWNLKNKTNIF